MNRFICFLFILTFANVHSQDTIYLGEFGSREVPKREMAHKYRFVEEDSLQKDVYNVATYNMDGSVLSNSIYYKYYKKKKQIISSRFYYENGQLHLLSDFKNGQLNGEFLSYWRNGKLKRKDLYDEGILISGTCWDENEVEVTYYKFEIPAAYPGGLKAMNKYIIDNFDLSTVPSGSASSKVRVSFYIDIDGSIVDVKLDHGPDPMTNYQAVNLVMGMPKWSPAMQDGHPVKVKMTLPIQL